MAKLIVEFDTAEKTVTASIDGQAIANPSEILIYKGYDNEKFSCSVTSVVRDKQNDMATVTRLVASEDGFVKEAPGSLSRSIAGTMGWLR